MESLGESVNNSGHR